MFSLIFLFKFIAELIAVVSVTAGLLSFFLGTPTFSDFIKKLDENPDFNEFHGLLFVIIVCGGILLVYKLWSFLHKANCDNRAAECVHHFYSQMNVQLMPLMTDLNHSVNNTGLDFFHAHVSQELKRFCDYIYDFLKYTTNKKFSVCIKLLCTHNNEKCTYTLCRSGDDRERRRENALKTTDASSSEHNVFTPVSLNTAFETLIDDTNSSSSVFSCSNLIMLKILNKILNKPQYKNPNKNFRKFYTSTIVVPIRINRKLIRNADTSLVCDNSNFLTIGFLCIDRKWPLPKHICKTLCNYLQGFADSLFPLLYKIHLLDAKLNAINNSIAH